MYQIKLQADPNIIDQLHTDTESLIAGVIRNEELRTAGASELIVIRELDGQFKYTYKFEQATTSFWYILVNRRLYINYILSLFLVTS